MTSPFGYPLFGTRISLPMSGIALVGASVSMLVIPAQVRADEGNLTISGFVDASWSGNVDTRIAEFGLDQVEVDFARAVGERGSLRADLEWVKEGEAWGLSAEQGFLSYRVAANGPNLDLSLGKFNAPIGFESLDAPDMYQYSHSLLFDYGAPTNLTGLRLDAGLTNGVTAIAYIVNGWDRNAEENTHPTYGGKVTLNPGERLAVGLSAISGIDEAAGDSSAYSFTRTVVDADVTVRPWAGTVLGGEVNLGNVSVGAADQNWTGFMVMAHHDWNDWLGLTGRVDSMNDDDGWSFGRAGGETRSSFTIAPTFSLGDGMGALVELRVDRSDEETFVDDEGRPTKSTTSVAFEATYGF